jgi:hypothetical protein
VCGCQVLNPKLLHVLVTTKTTTHGDQIQSTGTFRKGNQVAHNRQNMHQPRVVIDSQSIYTHKEYNIIFLINMTSTDEKSSTENRTSFIQGKAQISDVRAVDWRGSVSIISLSGGGVPFDSFDWV